MVELLQGHVVIVTSEIVTESESESRIEIEIEIEIVIGSGTGAMHRRCAKSHTRFIPTELAIYFFPLPVSGPVDHLSSTRTTAA